LFQSRKSKVNNLNVSILWIISKEYILQAREKTLLCININNIVLFWDGRGDILVTQKEWTYFHQRHHISYKTWGFYGNNRLHYDFLGCDSVKIYKLFPMLWKTYKLHFQDRQRQHVPPEHW
jgi:hypothetical protein